MTDRFSYWQQFRIILFCSVLSLCAFLQFQPEVASAADTGLRTMFDVRMKARDGVELSSDIWLPAKPGRYPVILTRTPYMKTSIVNDLAPFYVGHGYVFIIQDTRGRGDSGGEFDFISTDDKDGYDAVEWAAVQPWSNGKIGMLGVSYLANVQWMAARECPPHLTCIIPACPGGRWFNSRPYHNGAFLLAWALDWLNLASGRVLQQPNAKAVDWEQVYQHRPLLTMDEAMGRKMRLWKEWLQHDTWDDYWKRISLSPEDFAKIKIPVMLLTGWFDHLLPGGLSYWDGMKANSPNAKDRYLVIGATTHGQSFKGGQVKIGDMEFAPNAVLDMKALHLAFLDHYLKGTAPTFDAPHVRVYVSGSNKWLQPAEYPPPEAQMRRLYFHSGGKANSAKGDGLLSWDVPSEEPADKFTFDPKKPVPSEVNGAFLGVDQRTIEQRPDVLVYSTELLKDPVSVVGHVFVNLFAATDGRDTDFTAKLVDLYPDGRAVHIGSLPVGILRGRYRKSYERTELLTPNQTDKFRIELTDVSHTFLPGHRIRMEISSSAYPYIFPNPNTGNRIATDMESRIAQQTIQHNAKWPSHIELSVIPTP